MTALIVIGSISTLFFWAFIVLSGRSQGKMTSHELKRATKHQSDNYRDKTEGDFISDCNNWAPKKIPDWSSWDK